MMGGVRGPPPKRKPGDRIRGAVEVASGVYTSSVTVDPIFSYFSLQGLREAHSRPLAQVLRLAMHQSPQMARLPYKSALDMAWGSKCGLTLINAPGSFQCSPLLVSLRLSFLPQHTRLVIGWLIHIRKVTSTGRHARRVLSSQSTARPTRLLLRLPRDRM